MKIATIVAAAARAQIVVDFDNKDAIYSEGECDATTSRPPFADNDVFQTRWFRTPASSVAGTVSRVVFISRFQDRLCQMVRDKYSSLGSRQLRRALRNDDFAESAFSPVDDQDLIDEFDLIVNSRSIGMPLNFKRVDLKCIGDFSDGVCDEHAFRLCCPSIAAEKDLEITTDTPTTTVEPTTTGTTTTMSTLGTGEITNNGSIDLDAHDWLNIPTVQPECDVFSNGDNVIESWETVESDWVNARTMWRQFLNTSTKSSVCNSIRNPDEEQRGSRALVPSGFGVMCEKVVEGQCMEAKVKFCCHAPNPTTTNPPTTTAIRTTTAITTTTTLDYSKFITNDGSIDFSSHNFLNTPIIYPSCEGAYEGSGLPKDWQSFETEWLFQSTGSSIGVFMDSNVRNQACAEARGDQDSVDGQSRMIPPAFFGVKCMQANPDGSCETFKVRYCCDAIATTTTPTTTTTTPTTTTTTTTLGTGAIVNNGAIDFSSHDFINTPVIDVDCESNFEGSGDIEEYHSFETKWFDMANSWVNMLNADALNTVCNNVRDVMGFSGVARTSPRSFLPSFVGISCNKASSDGSCEQASVKYCCPALVTTTTTTPTTTPETTEPPVTGTSTEEPGSGDSNEISIEEVQVLISSWVESSIAASKNAFPGYKKLGKANRHINKMNKIIKKLIKKGKQIECGSEPGIENSRKFRKTNEEVITETFITPFLDILGDHKDCESYPAFEPRLQKMNNAFVKIFRKLN